jgi:hypothetical protein
VAREPSFPFQRCVGYTREQEADLVEYAGAITPVKLQRSAWDFWRAHHRWLRAQGYSSPAATDYLLNYVKALLAQQTQSPPPQPSFTPAPMQAPFPSPFGQQLPMNGVVANGR